MKSFPFLAGVALAVAACDKPAPGPTLLSVQPARVTVSARTQISLKGIGIDYAVSPDLDHPSQSKFTLGLQVTLLGPQGTPTQIELLEATRVSSTEVTAQVPSQLRLGFYAVVLTTALGSTRLPNGLEVAPCNLECAQTDGGEWMERVDTGGGGSHDWQTASTFGPGRLWIAGDKHVEVLRDGGSFVEVGGGCPNQLFASWADPNTGFGWLGGENANGDVVGHSLNGGTCAASQKLGGAVVGLKGFLRADGGFQVLGVMRDGQLIELQPSGQFTKRPGFSAAVNALARDCEGFSPASFFAAGSSGVQERPTIWRLSTDGGPAVDEGVEALAVPNQRLNAVWAVDDTLAYAVGSQGALVERSASGWRARPSADSALLSVRAFGAGRVYATTLDGRVMLFDGTRWLVAYQHRFEVPLTDIAATSEDDLWVVGFSGVVLHRSR